MSSSQAADIALAVIIPIVCATLLALILAYTWVMPARKAQVQRQHSDLRALGTPDYAVPGNLISTSVSSEAYTVYEAFIDGRFVTLRISALWAGLYVPGKPAGSRVRLQLGIGRISAACGRSFDMQYTTLRADLGMVTTQDRPIDHSLTYQPRTGQDDVPVMGLAPVRLADGTYESPLLEALRAASMPIAWSLIQSGTRLALAFHQTPVQCLQWCTSPMDTSTGFYKVPLEPTPATPWTSIVIDFGRGDSYLPDLETTTADVQLRTPTGCTFIIRQYETGPSNNPSTAVLGLPLGIGGGSLAFDISAQQFKYAAVQAAELTSALRV